jgi:hypothetical protein
MTETVGYSACIHHAYGYYYNNNMNNNSWLIFQEHSLTYEILRKVAPREAEFFKDPSTKIRVRFR